MSLSHITGTVLASISHSNQLPMHQGYNPQLAVLAGWRRPICLEHDKVCSCPFGTLHLSTLHIFLCCNRPATPIGEGDPVRAQSHAPAAI
jgi:hypothetical protein